MIQTQKQLQRGKDLIYTSRSHSSSKEIGTETQARQEPGAGADAEAMEEFLLLACSPWLAQLAVL